MKISEWIKLSVARLEAAGIGTARLDCLVLLEDATGRDRAYLLTHPEINVTGPTCHKLDELIRRRAKHEPLAYIRGKTEFYGRQFLIDERVLEPRPESETMINLLKEISELRSQSSDLWVVDVGTGSGALAITAKLEIPDAEVIAIDIDSNCLEIAKKNTKKHKVDFQLLEGDLLQPISEIRDPRSKICILANLPYVPNSHTINKAAMHEPKMAIFGGPDGLDLYRKLFQQIDEMKSRPTFILTESLPPQHKKLAEIGKQNGYKLEKTDDFVQLFEAAS